MKRARICLLLVVLTASTTGCKTVQKICDVIEEAQEIWPCQTQEKDSMEREQALYGIHDRKAEIYHPPFMQPNDQAAQRVTEESLPPHIWNHAEDYDLVKYADFETQKGLWVHAGDDGLPVVVCKITMLRRPQDPDGLLTIERRMEALQNQLDNFERNTQESK